MANTVKVGITAQDQGFKSTLDQLKSSANSFGQSLTQTGKKSQTLNGALREAQREAMNLAMAYSQLDDVAKSSDFGQQIKAQLDIALQAAGQLKDIKSDVQAEISNIASDTAMWDATAQGIGVVSSGLQGLASVYGLLGGDVNAFAQALVTVNAVQSAANTIIGIGNALQKQSALMVGLRAVKTALFGTTEAAATVAETANTAATSANTTATSANTAAKGANAAANTGQVGALGAATVAQLANNAAVLANPYVACAVAVAALTAAIVAWCLSTQEATDAELANTAATEAMNKQLDSAYDKVGEQINAFLSLKRTYDECGGSVDEIKRKIIDNKKEQDKARISVTNHDKAMRIFSTEGTKAFIDGAFARAQAMASEAAVAALLTEVMSELAKSLNAVIRGEEVNIADVEAIAQKAGITADTFKRMAKNAGFAEEHVGMFARNNLILKEGVDGAKAMVDLMSQISQHMMAEGGAIDLLNKQAAEWNKRANAIIDPYKDIIKDTEDAEKSTNKTTRATKNQSKSHSDNKKEIDKSLLSLESCDAVIQKCQQDMKKLRINSATYAEDMKKLKDLMLAALSAKLDIIDTSTLQGLYDARDTIQNIIKELPVGSELATQWNQALEKINEKIYDTLNELAVAGDVESLNNAKSQIEKIIKTLPAGSSELEQWCQEWTKVNVRINEAQRNIDNLKNGVKEGSVAFLEQELKIAQQNLDDFTKKNVIGLAMTIDKREELDALQDAVNLARERLADAKVSVQANVELKYEKPIDVPTVIIPARVDATFDYKKSPIERLERDIEHTTEMIEKFKGYKLDDVGTEVYNNIQTQIKALEQELKTLENQHTFAVLTDDVKQYNEELMNTSYDTFKGGIDALHSLYDVVTQLPDKLDECKNGFEGFFAVMEAGFSLVDSIMSFIEGIQKLIDLFNMMTGAKDALSAATTKNTAVTNINTAATQGNAAAQQMEAGADAQEAAASIGKAAANTAEASSEATSQMSSMGPFGWIAGIAAALAIAGALFGIISQAKGYAEGGIIEGNRTMGDAMIARVNSGEMIINQRQQSRLFKMIDHGQINNNNAGFTEQSVRISGEDIVVALRNYGKINGNTNLSNL